MRGKYGKCIWAGEYDIIVGMVYQFDDYFYDSRGTEFVEVVSSNGKAITIEDYKRYFTIEE